MYNNTFGNIFRLTSFGESHGKGIGGVIDGFPAGIHIDMDFIQKELDRRKPGQSAITTARKESDQVEFLSGIYDGVSTGCPIGFVVWNTNQHSSDYDNMKDVFRPSHADFTYTQKYGLRDHRGGGRSSARETISRVVAGALAKLALKQLGVEITAYTSQVGELKLEKDYNSYDLSEKMSGPGNGKDNGRPYFQDKGRRRHHRRNRGLRNQGMPHRSGTTCIRKTTCRTRKCHAFNKRRKRIRIRTGIRQHEHERQPAE